MALDKDLYRQAYEQYRQWNVAELKDRLYQAGKRPPGEGWQKYRALVEFSWQLCPTQSEWQVREKRNSLDEYYRRVQKLEEWRRAHGKTA